MPSVQPRAPARGHAGRMPAARSACAPVQALRAAARRASAKTAQAYAVHCAVDSEEHTI